MSDIVAKTCLCAHIYTPGWKVTSYTAATQWITVLRREKLEQPDGAPLIHGDHGM